jgi:hypothetical protein
MSWIALLVATVALFQVSIHPQPALAQADTQAPRVSSVSPSAGATSVSARVNVTASFNEPMQPASIAFALRNPANAAIPASMIYDSATRTVTLTPLSDLEPGTTYTATLSAAVDFAGNGLTAPVVARPTHVDSIRA